MDVLVYLAADPGTVIAKEELLEAVWGGAFVEEGALAQAVHSLRKALGDDARQPRFIQTIPKRGYRLVAPVEPVLPSGSETEPASVAVAPTAAAPPRRWRAWLYAAMTLLAVATILGLSYSRTIRLQKEETPAPPASPGRRIVVLPFEDINKPADSVFTKGLTEEITKDLSSLASLQVISRTSALQYEGVHKPLPEIGKELKVDYVLEGSVQWAPGADGRLRVRITPQLIRAADDSAVWSGQFDREVTDIFAVQSEISRHVISQLGIALTPEQKRALREEPTKNLEAYQAYLRGLDLRNQPFLSPEHEFKAVSMFERATELDPQFAAAWAELSQTHSYLAFNTDRSVARIQAARETMRRAVALDPNLKCVWLARIYFTYRCEKNYDVALSQLAEALHLFPNDAEVLQTFGFVLRRKGRLREAAEVLQSAFTLNPKAVILVWTIGGIHRAMRNYGEADRFFLQAISLAPDQPVYWDERAFNWLAWKGDLSAARTILAQAPLPADPSLLPASFELDFYAREYGKALSRLSPEAFRRQTPLARSKLLILASIARDRMGDHRGALSVAEANRVQLNDLVRRFPKEQFYPAFLAITLAQLGQGDAACALAEKTVRENRSDAFGGPDLVEFQAMTEAILGRHHAAVARLSWLLATPYRSAISVHEIRLNPIWDPLRADPEFEDLLRQSRD